MSAAAPIVDASASAGEAAGRLSEATTLWKRLLRRPDSLICLLCLLGLVIIAIVAPIAMPWVNHEQAGNLLALRQGPSWKHLLGTDSLGRDVLERLLVGTTPTMIGVGENMFFSFIFGVPLGLVVGYFGGGIDKFVMWLADLLFAMPGLIIVLVVLTVFPFSLLAAMCTLGVLGAPFLIRIVRSVTIVVREEPYIAAAQVSGLFAVLHHQSARGAPGSGADHRADVAAGWRGNPGRGRLLLSRSARSAPGGKLGRDAQRWAAGDGSAAVADLAAWRNDHAGRARLRSAGQLTAATRWRRPGRRRPAGACAGVPKRT